MYYKDFYLIVNKAFPFPFLFLLYHKQTKKELNFVFFPNRLVLLFDTINGQIPV